MHRSSKDTTAQEVRGLPALLNLTPLRFQPLQSSAQSDPDISSKRKESYLPKVGSQRLVTGIVDGRRGKHTGRDAHHLGLHLEVPSLELGKIFIVELLSPALDYWKD